MYHEESPDGVVGEYGAGEDEHCEAYEAVELVGGGWLVGLFCWLLLFGLVGCFLTGLLAPMFGVGLFGWLEVFVIKGNCLGSNRRSYSSLGLDAPEWSQAQGPMVDRQLARRRRAVKASQLGAACL
jgi:hypothetical protein